MIMLDYRACGPQGEPSVVHVDQESDYDVTWLAPDFGAFLRGLVHQDVYDTSEEDCAEALEIIETGAFSSALSRTFGTVTGADWDRLLRNTLDALVKQKGYFALHDDPASHFVYDVLFHLVTSTEDVGSVERYLGDGEITTRGYAPAFVEEWLAERVKAGSIATSPRLAFTEAYAAGLFARIAGT
jgi:hypothetical protein